MTMASVPRVLGRLLGGAVLSALAVVPRVAHANPGSGLIGDQPGRVIDTCFWKVPIRPDTKNILALDTNVTYYYSSFHLPAGASVVFRGKFPHSRFMSLTSYLTIGGQGGLPATALTDVDIDPDPHATNPFRDGASRTAHRRSYTVTVRGDVDPGTGDRAPNTLYVGQAGQTGITQFVELIYRIYRPDRGYDLAGGVVTPKPRLVRADGTTASGQNLCDDIQVVSGTGAPIPAFGPPIGFTKAQYDAVLALGPPTHPALEPTVWYRFFNQQRLAEPFFKGTILEGNIAALPTALTSGLYATPANAYIYGYASRLLGPDLAGHNLIVLHAKMPTHATTFDRVPVSDSGGKQVLGDYYPTGRYMTRADFEARGCPGTGSPGGAFIDG